MMHLDHMSSGRFGDDDEEEEEQDDGDGSDDDGNKTIGDEGITVDFRFIKVHTSN